jgi:LPS sulfotransferase NodH
MSISKSYERIKSYIYNGLCSTVIDHFDCVGFVWHLNLKSDLSFSAVDKIILLERKYRLAQFVSLKIAQKTDQWYNVITTEKIEIEKEEFFSYINEQDKLYKNFKSLGLEYKIVYYEDLCNNFDQTICSIQEYLGVDYFKVTPSKFLKQETRPLREVIKNYEEMKIYDGFYKI